MRVIIEADGGSRGNPGPAAYGALIRDADTGEIIAEQGEAIGVATNNVAEYRGLIAGLQLARQYTPEAELEVRMDSRLIIEQMAGRWKVKHPSMIPLAIEAQKLAPFGVEWTWVPREENKAADAILNAVLDEAQGKAARHPRSAAGAPLAVNESVAEPLAAEGEKAKNPLIGWRNHLHGEPTTMIFLRHGVTENTVRKLFCGSGGADPGLNELGEEQAARAAAWLKRQCDIDAVVSSPLRRTRETAAVVGRELGLDVDLEPGIAEAAFGEWDGLSFANIMERWPTEIEEWLGSTAIAPPGGETFDSVYERVIVARDRLLRDYAGKTIVAVSHVTPIKMMMRLALDAPMRSIYKMELAPASITTIQWWPDGTPSLRNFSVVPG
ncbi:bifunctional RNase H/acid phosphatase [Aeromicrobium sp.]